MSATETEPIVLQVSRTFLVGDGHSRNSERLIVDGQVFLSAARFLAIGATLGVAGEAEYETFENGVISLAINVAMYPTLDNLPRLLMSLRQHLFSATITPHSDAAMRVDDLEARVEAIAGDNLFDFMW